jgi:hypothetical protein
MKVLDVPGRAKAATPPPLSFRSEARNLTVPDRAKAMLSPPACHFKQSEKSCFSLQLISPSPV